MITLRASKADHAYACPPSLQDPWPDDPASEPALIGTAVHEAMASYLDAGDISEEQLSKIESKHGLEPSKFRPAFWQTRTAFDQICDDLPMAGSMETERSLLAEYRLEGEFVLTLTGHIDLCDFAGTTGFIVDYKTGWVVRSCEKQMRVYAALLFTAHRNLETVRVYVLRPRVGTVDVHEWTRSEILDQWLPKFAERITLDEQYRPHPATCRDCGLLPTCKPAQERMRGEAAALVTVEAMSLSPAQMVDVLRKVRAIKSQAESVEDWIRQHARHAGRIEGDGFAIEVRTTDKESVDWSKAKPVLQEVLTEEELDGVIQIGKGLLENAIRAKAPKGKKSKFLTEVWAELEADGAIEITTSERMEVRSLVSQTSTPQLEASETA